MFSPHRRNPIVLYEAGVDPSGVRDEIMRGLRQPHKVLPAKLFYDEIGSQLFEQICELDEYYLTRTETAIMQQSGSEMAALIGPRCTLIEFGSGSSAKTRILLDRLTNPAAYIAIDISRDHLVQSTANLAEAYPRLKVIPVYADYTLPLALPLLDGLMSKRVAYFPGSTVGNFHPAEAVGFLRCVAELVRTGGGLLIGVDLKKDVDALNAAYNDRLGVTAAFNLNMLARINREFDANFAIDHFKHHAFYNEREGRIEMHLISRKDQTVRVGADSISFKTGESVLSEVSYKYAVAEFARLADAGGFATANVWTDEREWFSVQYLVAR